MSKKNSKTLKRMLVVLSTKYVFNLSFACPSLIQKGCGGCTNKYLREFEEEKTKWLLFRRNFCAKIEIAI